MTHETRSEERTSEGAVRRVAADEATGLPTPFPRYGRISESLADDPTVSGDSREIEIPRTESFGELWQRAQRRRLGR